MALKRRTKKDKERTAIKKNRELSQLLLLNWKKLKIERIERVERVNPGGSTKGWRVFYIDDNTGN